jgi:hypothetical protein
MTVNKATLLVTSLSPKITDRDIEYAFSRYVVQFSLHDLAFMLHYLCTHSGAYTIIRLPVILTPTSCLAWRKKWWAGNNQCECKVWG